MVASEITQRSRVDEFLSQRRFAMAGVSRNPKDFSRLLFREFLKRGYDVIPVHPSCDEMEGQVCAPSIASIKPAVEGVLMMTSPLVTEALVRECVSAGVKRVWLYRAVGDGAFSPESVDFCNENGIDVVPGECPFMFLPGTPWFHRFHGLVKKITGTYPR
jgi:predicted CoA-binding protein